MKGFVSPEITKEEVRKVLTKEYRKTILELMGYKVVSKDRKEQKHEND